MSEKKTTLVSSQSATPSCSVEFVRPSDRVLGPIVFANLEQVVKRHLFMQTIRSFMEHAERNLLIQGGTGSAKTTTTITAVLRSGWALASVPMSELAGANEGRPAHRLLEIMDELVALSAATRLRIAALLDGLELSILSVDDRTTRTVHTALLSGVFQKLADSPKPYRNYDGSVIPLIFTGNDLTKVRESILRDARTIRYSHEPTREETLLLAYILLKPTSAADMKYMEKIVSKYRDQPIAFWAGLRSDLMTARIDKLIAEDATPAQAERELSKPLPFNGPAIQAAAEARAGSRIINFLSR